MNLPNLISFIRIIFIPLLVFLLLTKHTAIAVGIFVIVAISDYFDGYLARKLKQETNLGKFLDPLADKVLVISALLCLVELKAVSSVPVIMIVIRDFAVTALRLTAGSFGKIIAADKLGKYKTFILDIAVAMLIVGMPYADRVFWVGVLFTLVSGILYFIKNWKYLNG